MGQPSSLRRLDAPNMRPAPAFVHSAAVFLFFRLPREPAVAQANFTWLHLQRLCSQPSRNS